MEALNKTRHSQGLWLYVLAGKCGQSMASHRPDAAYALPEAVELSFSQPLGVILPRSIAFGTSSATVGPW